MTKLNFHSLLGMTIIYACHPDPGHITIVQVNLILTCLWSKWVGDPD